MGVLLTIAKFFLIAWVMPYLLGDVRIEVVQGNKNGMIRQVLAGYIVMWAFIQLVAIPMIYLQCSFAAFTEVCLAIFIIFALVNIVKNKKEMYSTLQSSLQFAKSDDVFRVLLLVLIGIQAVYVAFSYMSNDDDAFYVASAQTSLDTNTMFSIDPYTGDPFGVLPSRYVLSPFPMFVAFMSKMVGVRAPEMAHTFLPFVLIIFVYVVYFMWAEFLFTDNKKAQTIFMFFVMIILAFSNFTTHARGMMMFPRIWQGKGVLASILLPYILLLGMKMIISRWEKGDWIHLLIVMMATCHVSSMGIMLGAIEIGICAVLAVLKNKDWKWMLYTLLCCLPNLIYAAIYIVIK